MKSVLRLLFLLLFIPSSILSLNSYYIPSFLPPNPPSPCLLLPLLLGTSSSFPSPNSSTFLPPSSSLPPSFPHLTLLLLFHSSSFEIKISSNTSFEVPNTPPLPPDLTKNFKCQDAIIQKEEETQKKEITLDYGNLLVFLRLKPFGFKITRKKGNNFPPSYLLSPPTSLLPPPSLPPPSSLFPPPFI